MRGDRCIVAEDDYIVEDFFFICRVLEVRGTIEGDLLGVASNITIEQTATITGDLWVLGGKVEIEGTVGDDVHFIGISISVSDRARFTNPRIDLMAITLNVSITPDAAIPGDLLVYGYQALMDGTVGGDIDFSGEALIINGVVNGRVDASVGDVRRSTDIPGLPIYDVSFRNPGLRLGEEAVVGGNLSYAAPSRNPIPPGVVQGITTFTQTVSQPDITRAEQPEAAARIFSRYLIDSLRDLLTVMIIGVLGLRVVPNFVIQPAQNVQRRLIPTIGWGLVAFMLSFPTAVLLILISIVALLILFALRLSDLSIISAIGLVTANLALIGGFWFLLLFMGRVVVSFAVGQLICRYMLRVREPDGFRRWILCLVLGGIIYVLLTNIPLPAVGIIIELVVALAGIGAVVIYARTLLYASQLAADGGMLPPPSTSVEEAPPPVLEEQEVPLGMENLPEGFQGFDDEW